jgi:hypothetical protein
MCSTARCDKIWSAHKDQLDPFILGNQISIGNRLDLRYFGILQPNDYSKFDETKPNSALNTTQSIY